MQLSTLILLNSQRPYNTRYMQSQTAQSISKHVLSTTAEVKVLLSNNVNSALHNSSSLGILLTDHLTSNDTTDDTGGGLA